MKVSATILLQIPSYFFNFIVEERKNQIESIW